MPKKVLNSVVAMSMVTVLLVACGGNDAPETTAEQPVDIRVGVVTQPADVPEPAAEQPAGETPTLQAQYEALLAQANAAQAEATDKAKLDCTVSEQCATLTFRSPLAPCFFTTPLDYSTADSANAAEVEAAAARYTAAATAAEAIAPPYNFSSSCVIMVMNPLPLACIDNRCQHGFVVEVLPASGT